ncbi:MAG: DUF2065 domain-containing protein [Rhodospirillales bacterium]|nr:DUF2065 domain-containing protein [Rhodospirillales bacterium]
MTRPGRGPVQGRPTATLDDPTMSDGLTAFLTAIGLIFVIEGGLYALFPEAMRRSIQRVLAQPTGRLRTIGMSAALVGLLMVWLAN